MGCHPSRGDKTGSIATALRDRTRREERAGDMAERPCRPSSHLKALCFCRDVNSDILSPLDNSSHRPEGTFDENGGHINSMEAGAVHALRPCVMD